MAKQSSTSESPAAEIEELRARLAEAEETLNAIRSGSVDALVVNGPNGEQVFTLEGADHTYRRLVEEMSEGAVVLTTEGDILYCNHRFASILKVPLESVLGNPLSRFFSEGDRAVVERLLAIAPEGRGTTELDIRGEDGQSVPVHLSATSLALADVPAICLVVTDLTEQKRSQDLVASSMKQLEEEQIKANKLESLGILAGGLAHDLNNSLTAIFGNISLARKLAGSDQNMARRLSEAEMACMQARDVTEQLLTFAKGGAPVREAVSLDRLLKDWVGFALAGSNVQSEFDLAPDLCSVEIDSGQIGRVINNLVINAKQAMPRGGTITVRARNVTLSDTNRNPEHAVPLPAGEYVRIDIEDTGAGIPESYLPMIFDPYFTTKQKGSGLGLSVAYSIVKNHGGYLTVESQVGVGTTFHIYLQASSSRPAGDESSPEFARLRKLRVLVMDDQEAVREVISEILVSLEGHEVEFAADGACAIEMYEAAMKEGRPFDVVLMDLTIPGHMGGKEAINKLLEIDPRAKAIVVSGYANDTIMSRYEDFGFKGVIRKPFSIDDLLNTLQEVAGARG